MEPFATVEQYEAAYGPIADKEGLRVLLEDASRRIAAELEAAGIDPVAKGEAYAERLAQVCREAVHRCVDTHESSYGAVPPGVTQFSLGSGDFNHSFTFANVYTEPKLTKDERRFLGIPLARIAFIMPCGACDTERSR